jgi:hypothetical protein
MIRIALALLALSLSACTTALNASIEGETQFAIFTGSPEAVALIDFLNASTTTFEVLDDEVPLNRRTAENLILWRDGADGIRYTTDDKSFQTVADVDEVHWVGPAAMDAMVAYLEDEGLIPTGGDLLGVFDDVAFTVAEAAATLQLVNEASFEVLDDEVPLNSRSAGNILDARPIVTLHYLEAVSWVGPSAMLQLRNFDWTAPGDEPTEEDLAGPWDYCEADSDCQSGLVCMGWTMWGNGWCIDEAQSATFTGGGGDIPNDDATGWTGTVEVTGLASVPMDIIVWIDLEHAAPGTLTYTLIDPNGATASLAAPDPVTNQADITWRNITSDDMIGGTWSLVVADPIAGAAGRVTGWDLYLTSNYD